MSIASNCETSPLNHAEYKPLKTFNVDNEENSEMFAQALPAEAKDISTNWVKISGVEYRAGLVIWSGTEQEMPVFCGIKKNAFSQQCDLLHSEQAYG